VVSIAMSEAARTDESVALIVSGVVDDDTVERFERMLDSAIGTGSRRVVLDLTACRLASAGLAALIRLERRLRSRFAAAALVATDLEMLRLLEIAGVTSRFEIHNTLDAAIISARPAARQTAAPPATRKARRAELSLADVWQSPHGLVCSHEVDGDRMP
jgi:anti-sigma B factor antagonist